MKTLSILIILSFIIYGYCFKNDDGSASHQLADFDWIEFLTNYRDLLRIHPEETIKKIKQLEKIIGKNKQVKNWLNESIKNGKMTTNENASIPPASDAIPKHIKIYFKNLVAKLKKVPFKWG
jgi:hypothetical protein